MDTFFEQIISIKPSSSKKALCALIIILAAAITVFAVIGALAMFQFMFLFVLVIIGVWFGAIRLIGNFRIEYEYIITNGDLDIDVIIDKSRRKRIASIKCGEIESIKRYSFADNSSKAIICCNEQDEAYMITARDANRGMLKLVIAPDERIKSGIVKFLPRIIAKDAFI